MASLMNLFKKKGRKTGEVEEVKKDKKAEATATATTPSSPPSLASIIEAQKAVVAIQQNNLLVKYQAVITEQLLPRLSDMITKGQYQDDGLKGKSITFEWEEFVEKEEDAAGPHFTAFYSALRDLSLSRKDLGGEFSLGLESLPNKGGVKKTIVFRF